MTERISLEGKVAVVTGARRGLGRANVELLAERGARVVVNDLGTDVSGFGKDSTIAEQVADLSRSRGGEAIADDSDILVYPTGGTASTKWKPEQSNVSLSSWDLAFTILI
jgi:NAD(P)-dependent dehydrogenase (short-subunit alcohol dehydrogenase family)